jgi:DeoD family purine-nucleoside phosphorylase
MTARPSAPIHLRPTAPLASRALLPGDPGRALALAQALIEQPRMFNHHRGLWGYTGPARADGQPLTVQSTGMGGPSAAIVLEELIMLGLQSAVRVGTCGALDRSLSLGDLVLATEAIAADGVGGALSVDGRRPAADAQLSAALGETARPRLTGTIVSTDLFYDSRSPGPERSWRSEGALAVEMEAATLFALGARHGIAVGCLLAVSDVFPEEGERVRIEDSQLLLVAERMGAAATNALAGR